MYMHIYIYIYVYRYIYPGLGTVFVYDCPLLRQQACALIAAALLLNLLRAQSLALYLVYSCSRVKAVNARQR